MRRDHQTQRHARQHTPSRATHSTQPAPSGPSRLPSTAEVQAEDAREVHLVAPDIPPSPPPGLLLTPAEAARALHINRSTLYPLLMRGEIPSICIGRARRIPRDGLMRWIERQLSEQCAHDDGSA